MNRIHGLVALAAIGASVATGPLAIASPRRATVAMAPSGCTGPASATWLNISVDGVRDARGLIAITVYADDAGRFLARNGSLYVVRVPARAGATSACIFVPKPGTYAIAVYHDADANMRLNRSGLGLPMEGFGFSNNPVTVVGLPTFASVRLSVPRANTSVRIRLRYL